MTYEIRTMHDCPCCGVAVYSDDRELCSCCVEAGCETHDCGRAGCDIVGVYDNCQIPACPECGERCTFSTDGKWHANCECKLDPLDGGPGHGDTFSDEDRDRGPVEFSEGAAGERAREKWARAYEECDGAPEGEDDR